MKTKLIRKSFRLEPHVAEKLHREAKSMGLTQTAYVTMLISKARKP